MLFISQAFISCKSKIFQNNNFTEEENKDAKGNLNAKDIKFNNRNKKFRKRMCC